MLPGSRGRERTDLSTYSDSAPISIDLYRSESDPIKYQIGHRSIHRSPSALSITTSNAAEATQPQAAQSSDRTMPRL